MRWIARSVSPTCASTAARISSMPGPKTGSCAAGQERNRALGLAQGGCFVPEACFGEGKIGGEKGTLRLLLLRALPTRSWPRDTPASPLPCRRRGRARRRSRPDKSTCPPGSSLLLRHPRFGQAKSLIEMSLPKRLGVAKAFRLTARPRRLGCARGRREQPADRRLSAGVSLCSRALRDR